MNTASGRIFYNMTTGSLGTRRREFGDKDFPFVRANRADLDAFILGPCCFCGYDGSAPRTLFVERGLKSPAQLVQSSRVGFLRALKGATRSCLNCAAERRGPTRRAKRISKHSVPAAILEPSVVLAALRNDELDTSKQLCLVNSSFETGLSSDAHLTSVFSGLIQQGPRDQEVQEPQNPST
jgi:hypothetical protein